MRVWIDCHSVSDFGDSFGDDAVAGIQAAFDDPHLADALGGLDGANGYFVIRAHDSDLVAALQLVDGALRNQEAFLRSAVMARTRPN